MKRARLSECGCCGSPDQTFIYNVRHRGVYRRLCTACVLKNHPGSFCPICFEVYENPPPPPERAICLNCPSISHLSCVVRTTSKLPPRYQCPPCSNPNFSFFDISKKIQGVNSELTVIEGKGAIDGDTAKQLVAAAQIAVGSMNKAVELSRVEAEKKVREAVTARKKAKEALERLANLSSKEKIEPKLLVSTTQSSLEKRGQNEVFRVQNNGESVKSGGEKEMNVPPSVTRQ
ncbi:hypothetical protein LguiA_000915 [Lonicera macranthoides]